MGSSAEYSRCTCVDEMIDLHARLMNNFEHSDFSIEPTAVHRCVRKIIEFASRIDVLIRVVLNMFFFCLFVTQYVSQIETPLRTILIIKRVRVIFSHTDDIFYGKNTFCLF